MPKVSKSKLSKEEQAALEIASKIGRGRTKPLSGLPQGVFLKTLLALSSGDEMTHAQIAAITGREKGNKQRELTASGFINTLKLPDTRGNVYRISQKGLDYLASCKTITIT